jgi:hypothetical protein
MLGLRLRPPAVVTRAATPRLHCNEGSRPHPTGPDECKGDNSIVRVGGGRWTDASIEDTLTRLCAGLVGFPSWPESDEAEKLQVQPHKLGTV